MSDDEPTPLNELRPAVESTGDGPAKSGQFKPGQFKISTLLSWTAVICFLISWMRVDYLFQNADGNLSGPGFWEGLFIFAIFFAPPFTCIPFLIDQLLLKKNGLNFPVFWRIWLVLCVGIYSMLMLMLATVGFDAYWKGSKGLHWFYYTLDQVAGMSLWPIYAVGVVMFISMLADPLKAKHNVVLFFGPAICATISFWYVFACLCLNFTGSQNDRWYMAIIPGAPGLCYALYCAITLRNCEFSFFEIKKKWKAFAALLTGLLISVGIKIPLAKQIYAKLPDEMPEGCFIVTAATRGHRDIVGTWFDADQDRLLNQQLLTFWAFESSLKANLPTAHRTLRSIYNAIGPPISKCILFRWQADLVYLMLKPIELLIRLGF